MRKDNPIGRPEGAHPSTYLPRERIISIGPQDSASCMLLIVDNSCYQYRYIRRRAAQEVIVYRVDLVAFSEIAQIASTTVYSSATQPWAQSAAPGK